MPRVRLILRVLLEAEAEDHELLTNAAGVATSGGASDQLVALVGSDVAQALQYLAEPGRLVQGLPVKLIGSQKQCVLAAEGESYCDPGL